MPQPVNVRLVKSHIAKAATPTAVGTCCNAADCWIPNDDMRGKRVLKQHSTILPQCIRAYAQNIAGFGLDVRYKADVTENKQMANEFDRMKEILNTLSRDCDLKEVFETVIEQRETYGVAYLEVVRNIGGEVVTVDAVRRPESIRKTPDAYDDSGTKHCKYKQEANGNTVYFRDFGDLRVMDVRTGNYDTETPIEYRANEILSFRIGTEPYGEVRWRGQLLGVDGSRRAENINNRYFKKGRHVPLLIQVDNGRITDEGYKQLKGFMHDIEGEEGAHGFMLLETESLAGATAMDEKTQPKTTVVKLADVLQKDELFQDYLENNRRRVQSAFQLPDVYTGYSRDFNRATAQVAQEITEAQVFQPERQSLAWVINHKLLACFGFTSVECYFKPPQITNPDDLTKLLNIAERGGAMTPNKLKEVAFGALGETSEPFKDDWGEVPLAVQKLLGGEQQSIEKSADNDALVAVMKEVRRLLDKGGDG